MKQSFLVISILSIIIFYALFMILSDITQLLKDFISVNLFYLPFIFSLQIIAVLFRALRQKTFLDSLGLHLSIKYNMKIQFASLSMIFTPGGAGEGLKSYYLKNKFNYSYGKTISVFLVEKYHDLLGAIIVLSLFLIFSDILDSKIIVGILWIPLIFAYIIVKNKKILSVLSKISKFKLFKKISNEIPEMEKSLYILFYNKVIIKGIIFSVCAVITQAIAFYLVFLSFEFDISFIDSVIISYTAAIIGAISFLPGGIGLTESTMVGLLVQYGFPISISSALVIFSRLTGVWFLTIIGIISTKFLIQSKQSN